MTAEGFFPGEPVQLELLYVYGLLCVSITNPYPHGFVSGISSKLNFIYKLRCHNRKEYLRASLRAFP